MKKEARHSSKYLTVKQRALHCLVIIFFMLAPPALSAPGDLVLPRKEGGMSVDSMPASVFPHWIHRVRYRCDACHTRLFKMELGATDISMDKMKDGQSCAVCHNGERAFTISMQSCNRCHTVSAEE